MSAPRSLRVEVAGDATKPAIVLLHGLGVSSWMWSDQVEHLSSRFSCLSIDLPGNGASSQTPWRSFDDSADAVADLIAETPAGRAHVVGLSLGGYVAVRLVARRPAVVDHLIVSGITAEPLRPVWRYRLLTRLGAAVVRQPSLAWATAAALRLPPEARDAMVADARVLSATTTRRIYDEILDFELPEGLLRPADRVLAVAAEHDVRSVHRGLETFAALGATTAVVRNAHHAWNAEHPQLFNDMIEDWVRDRTVTPGLDVPAERIAGNRGTRR
jgi:pimeloyl-ACP methyl ester carboxylesterase